MRTEEGCDATPRLRRSYACLVRCVWLTICCVLIAPVRTIVIVALSPRPPLSGGLLRCTQMRHLDSDVVVPVARCLGQRGRNIFVRLRWSVCTDSGIGLGFDQMQSMRNHQPSSCGASAVRQGITNQIRVSGSLASHALAGQCLGATVIVVLSLLAGPATLPAKVSPRFSRRRRMWHGTRLISSEDTDHRRDEFLWPILPADLLIDPGRTAGWAHRRVDRSALRVCASIPDCFSNSAGCSRSASFAWHRRVSIQGYAA